MHSRVVRDSVRTQNRLKALYRSRGIVVTGKSVYTSKHRGDYLVQLPSAYRDSAELMYAQYDALHTVKKEAEKQLIAVSHRHGISKVLETCPGLGPIRVAQAMSVILTPHRFRGARQLWAYSGLGVVMRSSSDWVQTPGGWQRAELNKTRGLNRRR